MERGSLATTAGVHWHEPNLRRRGERGGYFRADVVYFTKPGGPWGDQ